MKIKNDLLVGECLPLVLIGVVVVPELDQGLDRRRGGVQAGVRSHETKRDNTLFPTFFGFLLLSEKQEAKKKHYSITVFTDTVKPVMIVKPVKILAIFFLFSEFCIHVICFLREVRVVRRAPVDVVLVVELHEGVEHSLLQGDEVVGELQELSVGHCFEGEIIVCIT